MAERNHRVRITFIYMVVGVIAVSQYATDLNDHRLHIFYQGLFFIPVVLAGFWFGLKASLITSLSITGILLPFTFIHWNGFSAGDFNNVMELVLYNGLALIVGTLKNRERAEQKRFRQVENLTAMGKAVSSLAHDLKTPLIAIGGLIQLVQGRVKGDDSCRERLGMALEEVRRLERMTEEMLDFSRPLELHRRQVDMNQLWAQIFEIVSPLAVKNKILLKNESPLDLPVVSMDGLRVKQGLINLLINAVEASPPGETVRVLCYTKRKRFYIEIWDHGPGIPADRRTEIFVPFYTTKPGGTGLGLPIAKKIVEAHQGSVEVLDNFERGSIFRIVI